MKRIYISTNTLQQVLEMLQPRIQVKSDSTVTIVSGHYAHLRVDVNNSLINEFCGRINKVELAAAFLLLRHINAANPVILHYTKRAQIFPPPYLLLSLYKLCGYNVTTYHNTTYIHNLHYIHTIDNNLFQTLEDCLDFRILATALLPYTPKYIIDKTNSSKMAELIKYNSDYFEGAQGSITIDTSAETEIHIANREGDFITLRHEEAEDFLQQCYLLEFQFPAYVASVLLQHLAKPYLEGISC